ncbi:MAG: hypothetical protein IPL78_35930 [Chloroflexi bacterium]|nr:hypothetical protein [Chloroflexota bacterium]
MVGAANPHPPPWPCWLLRQPPTTFVADEEFGFWCRAWWRRPRHGPLTFVGFSGCVGDGLGRLSLRGRIAVLLESNAPPTFATEALRRGAQGVIWLTDEAEVTSETHYAEDAAANYLRNPALPIMRLSRSATERFLQRVGLNSGRFGKPG